MDNLCDLDSVVALRNSYVIYHGRSDSYSARDCHYRGAGKRCSRAEVLTRMKVVNTIRPDHKK